MMKLLWVTILAAVLLGITHWMQFTATYAFNYIDAITIIIVISWLVYLIKTLKEQKNS